MTTRPKVFLDAVYWDVRSRNMDWRYVRYTMPLLANFEPDLQFVTPRSAALTLAGNFEAIAVALGRRIGIHQSMSSLATGHLSRAELQRSQANLIYTRTYPLNAGDIPIVWSNAIVDPAMQLSYGVTPAVLQQEIAAKSPLFQRCAHVCMYTQAEVYRHIATFPDAADRFVHTPMFAPHIHACTSATLEKHRNADPVRILFVGNHALRKGLQQLLEAFLNLPASIQSRALLTVISNFDRSRHINLPTHDRIRILRGAPSAQVMQQMAESHIFVNVAHFESYGLVFHEAMSQGLAILGPQWEVQRELLDNGNAGLNLPCETSAIGAALERLIVDEEERYRMAHAAWQRFQIHLAAPVSAAKYHEVFCSVLES